MPTVKIRKIRTNFQVRFAYDEDLIKYIKTIPSDQIRTTFETVIVNGEAKKDWFHICNAHALMKIMWYCQDKHFNYQYENVSEKDIFKIETYVKQKKEQVESVEEFRKNDVDVSQEDYFFMKIQPYNYQKKAVKFFELCKGVAILGDQPGVGKSLSAMSYAVKHQLKTIIICPASMVLIWAKEILKFSNEKPFVFKYKIKKKENLELGTPEESLIHIVSYNALDTYLKFDVHHKCENPYCDFEEITQIKKHKMCPKCFKEKSVKSKNTDLCTFVDKKGYDLKVGIYDLIVMDEAHYIKNPKAQRTKLITKAFKKIPKKLLLSGTAIKSKPFEFFVLLNFLDPFEWVNSHSYGIRYCDGQQDDYGHWNYNGYSRIEELVNRLSYMYLRRRKKDPGVLEHLPPKTFTIIPIDLTSEEAKEYKKLEGKIIDEANQNDDDMTHLTRIQKLKFFTSKICAERAYEFIQNIIDGDEKIVVFSQYIETSKMIYERFQPYSVWYTGKKSADEKEIARESFMNDENIKVFAGTIGAAGVGITLTSASTVLFLDQPWTPSDREQAEDRCIVKGQLIMTKEGFKQIENIKIGELVYTSFGNWNKVINTSNRIERKKALFKIKYYGFNQPLEVTEDHKIYIYDNIEKAFKYIEAKNLNIFNHYLVFSNPNLQTTIIKELSIDRIFGHDFISHFGAQTSNGRIKNPLKKIKITNKLMYALGWYLAEGWVSIAKSNEKGSIVAICGNQTTEVDKVNLVAQAFLDCFGLNSSKFYTYKSKKNCYSAFIYSKNLAVFFENTFGKTSKDKKIPDFVFNTSKNNIRSFLHGYYDGDGYQRDSSQQASTKSDMIAIGLCQLEALFGNPIRLTKTCWNGWSFEYTMRNLAKKDTLIKNIQNHVLFPINEITISKNKKGQERVYDLTIENDESFTVGLAAVHNCHRASQTSDKVQIIRMICQDTIDEDIEKLLNDKETITSQVLDGEIITKDVKLSIFKDIVNLIVRKKNF